MKIASSAIAMASSHSLEEEHIREESLEMWRGDTRPGAEPPSRPDAVPVRTGSGSDLVTLSKAAIEKQFQQVSKPSRLDEQAEEIGLEDPRLRAMRLILEALTGEKMTVVSAREFMAGEPVNIESPVLPAADSSGGPQPVGWGLAYDYFERHAEQEVMDFEAGGTVVTTDGVEINFQLQLTMSRELVEETRISIRAGDALLVDPLVINFDGPAAALTDMKFSFDLDADGRDEAMSFVGPGSGFLALDRNKDGIVNNGSELFGPGSGSGFAELAAYDTDGNGWLDENDPIYHELVVWSKDAAGTDYLVPLKDRNIGALLLSSAQTEFSFKQNFHQVDGQLTHTSIFLRENGTVGTMQEIDLAV